MPTYHYHAIAQVSGGTVHIDGVMTRERQIVTGEDYSELKQCISDYDETLCKSFGGAKKLTICSLTMIAQ